MTVPDIEWSTQTNPDQREGALWIDLTSPYFAGHFPGNPILPGFVQIRWARMASERVFPDLAEKRFTGMSRIKFKRAVGPATLLHLTVVRSNERASARVKFVYRDDLGTVTQGDLHFDV